MLNLQDVDYIKKYYTVEFDKQQAVSEVGGRDDSARVKKGESEFQPMYLIKQLPDDPRKLVSLTERSDPARRPWLIRQEMCFDCTAFQYQLDNTKPLEDHVYQTIFLNNKHSHMWQKDEIKKDKISRSRLVAPVEMSRD